MILTIFWKCTLRKSKFKGYKYFIKKITEYQTYSNMLLSYFTHLHPKAYFILPYLFYMWHRFVYMCTTHVSDAYRGQERALALLWIELDGYEPPFMW